MWEQYQKTFFRMQALILLVVCSVFVGTDYQWRPAVKFFAAMQMFSLFGAMWATRLKQKTTHTERY